MEEEEESTQRWHQFHPLLCPPVTTTSVTEVDYLFNFI